MDYISIIPVPAGALYSTEPFFLNIFFVFPTGGTGGKGGEQEEEEGRRRETHSREVTFKHTSLLKTKVLISSDPDSFRFALEKIVGTKKTR